MRRFERLPAPQFLAEKSDEWGVDWERRQTTGGSFHWHQIDKQPVNHLLLLPLKEQTQEHCSFCDNFPVSPPSIETIEHFRPKSRFPRDAYKWENLYYCCTVCQQKGEDYDDKALKPDSSDYVFERYFCWDFTSGAIKPNPSASFEDQGRAETTIRLFKLNEKHPRLRRLWLLRRQKLQDEPIESFPYRDFVESSSRDIAPA